MLWQGPARRRNRKFVEEARSSRPPRPQNVPRARLGQRLIASSAAADLNNSGRGPSRRVPHWKEVSGCPASDGTRDEAARIPCGGSAKVSAAAPLARPGPTHRSRAAARRSHRFHQKRWAPLGRRSPAAARLTAHLPWTVRRRRHATMTKGRRRLKHALIITCTIACPVGLDNGEVCSGHGACAEHVSKGIDETCVCDYGFSGPDCSLRLCPAARAWSDYASSNNTAHARHVECANMGESRRPAVPRCLHAIDATRVHQTGSWVVYFFILRLFGPI